MDRKEINSTIKEFFDGWGLYKKFVDTNIMFHKEMYHAIGEALAANFGKLDFSILDLGCGDSAFISKNLAGLNVNQYTGIDLSEEATKLAGNNLHFMQDRVEFIHSDFIEAMRTTDTSSFDVVFTSYALHHYTTEEKQDFFKLAHAILKPNGILIVLDVILSDHQTIAEFLAEELEFISKFKELSAKEFAEASEHITSADIPETLGTYKKLTANAKLSDFQVICKQPFFQTFTCKKA